MNKDQLHPEIRKEIASLPTLPFHSRRLLPIAKWLYNFGSRSKLSLGVDATDLEVNGLKLRMYCPESLRNESAIFWVHGGGYVAGTPRHLDSVASLAARTLGIKVFAPQYRLAPKHPFPSGLNDIRAAWEYLNEHAKELKIDPTSVAVAGNSAGGGLAAALVQQLMDSADAIKPVAQCLFYPMLDDRTAANSDYDSPKRFIWGNDANRVAWNSYLSPSKAGDDFLPDYAAPARTEQLITIPPTWLGICELDLFHDEDQTYANRLIDAGVDCEIYSVEGVPHAFEVIKPDADISKAMVQSAIDFFRAKLSL